jgi:hypothetical protein
MFFGWQSINHTNFPPVLLISVCGQAIMACEGIFFAPPPPPVIWHVKLVTYSGRKLLQLHTTIHAHVHLRESKVEGCRRGRPCTIWLFNRSGKDTIPKIRNKIFPEKEMHGYSPNFYIHVSVSELYIPLIGLPILLQENRCTERGKE